jgi:DNA polymerase-1
VSQIKRSRDIFAAFNVPIYEHEGFEADDMLGTIVEQCVKEKHVRVIIASGDMDTLQLVHGKKVLVYTLKKGLNDTVLYDETAVMGRFGFSPLQIPDFKGLRGDPSDNIPGIKGVGEKTATELIKQFGTIEKMYTALKKNKDALIRAGIKERMAELIAANEDEAVFSKMLATIRRDAPIQFLIPKESWKQSLDGEKILNLFAELGFRTLATRIKNFLEMPLSSTQTPEGVVVSDSDLARAQIALWLLSSDTTNPTLDDIMQYGRMHKQKDFNDTLAYMEREIEAEGLSRVYREIELPLTAVLREMERVGITVDVPHLSALSKKMHAELSKLEAAIYAHAGTTFNINSPKQLGDVLYDTLGLKPKNQKHTATGQRSTREAELEKMRDMHPIIEDVLRYREVQKLVSTYVDVLPKLVDAEGRIHTTFLQSGSVTGRMASQNPGVQNIPVRTEEGREIRKAFIAAPGYVLASIDYSQVELRVAAFLSGDKKLIEIFKNGEDVHQGVAARVFKVEPSEVTPNMRREAKVINFGILYGMGVNALRANLGPDTKREAAQEFLNAYFNTFTRLAEYLEETKAFARANGYTTTFFGRRRHFPGMNSSAPFIRAQAERMAINAPVQGTAADIIRIAMVRINEYLKKAKKTEDARMLLQVHDELVFEIRKSAVHTLVPELRHIMESVLSLKETQGVPIRADAKVGPNWDTMSAL